MKSLSTWNLILTCLHGGIPVMLLYVVNSQGSSPGRTGFSMAVTADGDTEGSLGGGIMEHKFVELAKKRLVAEDFSKSIHHQVHNKIAVSNQSGMICSGEQTIAVYPVSVTEITTIETIVEILERGKQGLLNISPRGITVQQHVGFIPAHFQSLGEDWLYAETLGYLNRLYIIGGGHCALALSRIMRVLDFYIEIFEERTSLKTLDSNEFADQKHLIDDYAFLSEMVPEGEHAFIVIMTVGYRTDGIALRALLEKKVKYLGVLGSSAKIEKMFSDLRTDGYLEETIRRIHAPVGIPIHSQTPEEVAISIAAEIIGVKNSEV